MIDDNKITLQSIVNCFLSDGMPPRLAIIQKMINYKSSSRIQGSDRFTRVFPVEIKTVEAARFQERHRRFDKCLSVSITVHHLTERIRAKIPA